MTKTVQSHGAAHGDTRSVVRVFPRMAQDTEQSSETPPDLPRKSQVVVNQSKQLLVRRIVPAAPKTNAPCHQFAGHRTIRGVVGSVNAAPPVSLARQRLG